MRRVAPVWALALAVAQAPLQAADYRFDLSEIEPKRYEINGFLEGKGEHFRLRPSSSLFPLTFGAAAPRRTLDRGTGTVEVGGRYGRDAVSVYGRVKGSAAHDALDSDGSAVVLEGGLRISPSEGFSIDLGKQVQRWGKGYAWNPVAFFERAKDPNDPTASREGFVIASADWVRSLPGTLAAIGFTPLALPTASDLNSDYGAGRHGNLGAKLYLLYADTDIDLLWSAKGSRPERLGIDFSRNLGANLEVHGEWSRASGATRRVLTGDGTIRSTTGHLDSWLIGARYLTTREVTWIAELYRNGGGYDDGQLGTFYRFLSDAYGPGGTPAARSQAMQLTQSGYGRANPGRRYAYLRVSAKDPFDWLYLTPALTTIVNLDDQSWQLTPEIVYTGWQNLELRARLVMLQGGRYTEFGEKPASRRLELSLRLYF